MNRKKRQRLPRIKPSIKRLIVEGATSYREKPRLALAADIRDTIERIGEISPSEETLIKMISDARNKKTSPLDNPWHMGLLEQYQFSPEAVTKIFDLMIDGRDITVRRAIWISRFCMLPVSLDLLSFMSNRYAAGEFLSQLSGEPVFDTTAIDQEFIDVILSKPEKAKSYVAFHKRDPEKLKSIRNELERRKVKNERSHSTKGVLLQN